MTSQTSTSISICQYPITTLLVDDNIDFLKDVHHLLLMNNILNFYYDDPVKALRFLNEDYKADPFTNHCIKTQPHKDPDSYLAQFDLKKIYHEVYNPHRFDQIGVLGIDQFMPALSGLDFCRQVQDKFCLKFVLTGEAGLAFAVDAFNEGIIDKFLQKGIADLPKTVVKVIQDLQQGYFLKLSQFAINTLYKQAPACLTDPVFIQFFNELCKKNNIVEYYLLDEFGSFLLLNTQGIPSWLIIKSEHDMAAIYEFASDDETPVDILDALKTRKLIPYFHTEQDWKISYADPKCRDYLHPAQPINGKQTYYYAYLTNPDAYYLERDKILSLEQYLSKI